MSIETSISGSSCQVLALLERDMASIWLPEELGEAKVNDEDSVFVLVVTANKEVVWLDVSVDYTFVMDLLDSAYHLNGAVADS